MLNKITTLERPLPPHATNVQPKEFRMFNVIAIIVRIDERDEEDIFGAR